MEKVTTSLLLNKDLRDLAKARHISISKTCNEALEARLSLPDTKEEIIVQKHKLKQELGALEAKEAELDKVDAVKSRREILEQMEAEVKELRGIWARKLDGKVDDAYWAGIVSKFCKNWGLERAVAIAYAEGKKEVIG